MARARTFGVPGTLKLFCVIQFAPLSVLLNTPLPAPTYIVEGVAGSNTRDDTEKKFSGIVLTELKLLPPSVDLKSPLKMDMKTVEELVGSTANAEADETGDTPLAVALVQVVPASVLR